MKFWTIEWFTRDNITHEDYQTVWADYKAYLETLRDVLPNTLFDLAFLHGIDDGLIVSVQRNTADKILTLTLRCGDLQIGYFDLVLRYANFYISREYDQTLARLARATKTVRVHPDIASHEIDTAENGQVEYRFLFHPSFSYDPAGYQWFAIRADSLTWEKVPQPNRDLPDIPDRFPGGPLPPSLSLQERIQRVDPALVRRYVQKNGQ